MSNPNPPLTPDAVAAIRARAEASATIDPASVGYDSDTSTVLLGSSGALWGKVVSLPGRVDAMDTGCFFAAARADVLALCAEVERLRAANAGLLAACRSWVDYFDRLTRDDEPGDPLAELRNHFHRERVEATRAAIAQAEQPQPESEATR